MDPTISSAVGSPPSADCRTPTSSSTTRTCRGVTPSSPFRGAGKGGWGAWQVAARYGELRIDDEVFDRGFASRTTSAERARAWTLGVNWYLNPFVKISLNYDQTHFEDGATDGDRSTEGTITSRFQVAF